MKSPDRHKKLKINLVARDNGFGLSRDITLLKNALEANDCEVHVTALGEQDERRRWKLGKTWPALRSRLALAASRPFRQPAFDISIMFEHLWPEHFHLARTNVALPNPEWFDKRDLRHLGRIDHVWVKTHHAKQIYDGLGCATSLVGFDSDDAWQNGLPKQQSFFHLAGGSQIKGTDRLIALWGHHPEWPLLVVLQHQSRARAAPSAANIQLRAEHLSQSHAADALELRRLQNTHRFHICTSEIDAWGHYAIEALSVGAVVFATNAPPMNELIDASRGLLVDAHVAADMGLTKTWHFDEGAMERMVTNALSMGDAECSALGHRARDWFLKNKAGFASRIGKALSEIGR